MKRLAIVGFGGMGNWHGEYARKSDVVELAGIYDIKEERREYAASKGIYTYKSLDEVLNDSTIDLITVATPNDVHKEIVISGLKAGKNMISEKPVTVCSSDLQDMIDASKKYGKLFTVHQNRRWDADFLSMKEVYNSGVLGEIFNIESRVHGSRGIPGDWRGKKEHGGGMMLDWGVHLLDQILQMVDEKIKFIYAKMDHITNYEVDDGFKMDITFESGKVVHVEVGTSNFINMPRWYMQGTNGTAIIPEWKCEDGKIVCCDKWDEKDVIPVKTAAGLTKTMAPRNDDSIITRGVPCPTPDVHDFYRNICKAIDGKEEQLIKHDEMMRVMRVMEASFESDKLNQVIEFKE